MFVTTWGNGRFIMETSQEEAEFLLELLRRCGTGGNKHGRTREMVYEMLDAFRHVPIRAASNRVSTSTIAVKD